MAVEGVTNRRQSASAAIAHRERLERPSTHNGRSAPRTVCSSEWTDHVSSQEKEKASGSKYERP